MHDPDTRPQPSRARTLGSSLLLPVALVLALVLLAAGTIAVNELAARWLLTADAEATGHAWAAELRDRLGAELPALLARRPPSPAALAALGQAQRVGGVFRYKLFDAAGTLVFVSDDLTHPEGVEATLAMHRGGDAELARRLLAGGNAYVEAKRGTPPTRPAFYAEAYVPILLGDGRAAGVAEAYVDQSAKRALYAEVFLVAQAAIAIVVLAVAGVVGVALRHNLKQRRAAEIAAQALAAQDPLTGLPNRRGLAEGLDVALAPGAGPAVLCMVDLDGFKAVNDAHGHAAGDVLLRLAAARLRAAARGAGDLVARLGGDEFAVLARLAGAGSRCPKEVGAELAARLVAAFAEPFSVEATQSVVRLGVSVGVALAPGNADASGPLLRRADLALYRAKAEGRDCFRLYEAGMDAPARERAAREAELRTALAEGALEPHFQPLVDLASGRLLGFEALARWQHPTRGWVAPAEFVPLAEETGLIWSLTEALLGRACAVAAGWPGSHLVLSFNISPVQLREHGRLSGLVSAALAASGLPARRLQLEVTEGALTGDIATARQVLAELKACGVRLALDDFGTGHSGLRELQALPFDTLKLDRSFVRAAADQDTAARRIVAAVVGLGQSLGLPVVAEGVEAEHDAEMLRVLGCDAAQGWLFGRPEPAEQATARAAAPRLEAEQLACS